MHGILPCEQHTGEPGSDRRRTADAAERIPGNAGPFKSRTLRCRRISLVFSDSAQDGLLPTDVTSTLISTSPGAVCLSPACSATQLFRMVMELGWIFGNESAINLFYLYIRYVTYIHTAKHTADHCTRSPG